MSDGTPQIRVWDPVSLQEKRRVTVHDGSKPVNYVNELECVRGEIYANVWQTDRIVRISPSDGRVLAWVNLASLLNAADRLDNTDVLNGIAYDTLGDRLFVTGKFWPKLFEIKIVSKSGRNSSAK
jgi:glutaminyl-peptide cyclotransferase